MTPRGRTYGELWLEDDRWHLRCEPHVAMYAKRVFQKIPTSASGVLTLPNTPSTCRDLEWFQLRFDLDVKHPEELARSAASHRDHILCLNRILDPNYQPDPATLALPARDYQLRGSELFLTQGFLLLGDEVGLGKTVTSIAAIADENVRPAVVVCPAHLPLQWEKAIAKFAPDLRTHVLQRRTPYELPKFLGRGPDVIITSYHKLSGWVDILTRYAKSVVYDEIQDLRRGTETNKGRAAKAISDACRFRLGLSATPIYNYGGEIFNVFEFLNSGVLGERAEFIREWCVDAYSDPTKAKFKDPEAFGSFLRENHLMLRRTRKDVGRELKDLTRITQPIDCDETALDDVEGAAGELARILLSHTEERKGDRMQAAAQFDAVLRQATGISKAPHVAAFVRMLIESGEPVVLYGWHKAVYRIWQEKLRDFEPAFYTGAESSAEKECQVRRFVEGETDLIIISLRAGSGLDGLQHRCRTVVFGELDWSPGVQEQDIGRVYRDGQTDPVMVYFLLSEGGLDPFMAETLGLKSEQIEGLQGDGDRGVVERIDNGETLKRLASEYLKRAESKAKRKAG